MAKKTKKPNPFAAMNTAAPPMKGGKKPNPFASAGAAPKGGKAARNARLAGAKL